jgi:hypothetical protein
MKPRKLFFKRLKNEIKIVVQDVKVELNKDMESLKNKKKQKTWKQKVL